MISSSVIRRRSNGEFVAISPAMREIDDVLGRMSGRLCTVLLQGETGTGKELVAREIHRRSGQATGPFVPVDCTSLSGEMFASQLFGHVRGAFTGAISDSLGFVRAANGGTLFLDEIGDLDLGLQSKLLRLLQEGMVSPLGSTEQIPVDIRVIAATNAGLEEMVLKGRFRSDLYYRLNVVQIKVPPLRARPEDIVPLARHFLLRQAEFYEESQKQLTPGAEQVLLAYSWPGNVRELANVIERAVVMSLSTVIDEETLSGGMAEGAIAEAAQFARGLGLTLDFAEHQAITKALAAAGGRKRRTAELLQIDWRRLNRLLIKHAIDPASYRTISNICRM